MLRRECLRYVRHHGELVYPIAFFVFVVTLFPFALGSDPELLRRAAAGAIWIAALLAATLSLDGLYRGDYADGSMELMALSGAPLAYSGLAKAAAHWLTSTLPILLLAAPVAAGFGLDARITTVTLAGLALGSAAMSLIGSAIAALTVGLRAGGMLLALLMVPMYIPILIFGTAASANAALDLSAAAELYFLAGLLVLALSLAPWAAAAAIRIRLS